MNKRETICPVCRAPKNEMHVACRRCWFRISKITRNKIWRLFNSQKTRGSVEHVEAIREGIAEAKAAYGEAP